MDGIDNILDVKNQDHPGEPSRSVAERREASPDGPDSYLEIVVNVVDGTLNRYGTEHYIMACGCKCWFCPGCCLALGLKRRELLTEILESFEALQMWTFTIDPLLFDAPATAFEYVRKKRSISELVRALKKEEYLISKRYFYVLEWQKNTEMPHWHLLLETRHLPFDFVCMIWNRNRPKEMGLPEGDRPGFGSVRFSAPRFQNNKHAANYATKYLIKHPKHGYPDWVLDLKGRVPRYGTSRGFWQTTKKTRKTSNRFNPSEQEIAAFTHEADCFCGICRGEPREKKTRRKTNTIRDRTKICQDKCVVMRNELGINANGNFASVQRCLGAVPDSYKSIRLKMNPDRYIDERRIRLEPEEVMEFLGKEEEDSRNTGPEWTPEAAFDFLPRIKEDTK
ncbi:MAG: hypothetical protein JKY95_06590 [Planctomycetaceae bacterium]|nr:hypothetical protein [Planctomycetaceae bacterium]